MSQFSPNAMAASRAKGRPNVYTLMLVVAFLALVVACAYVVVRHNTLFGDWNPFKVGSDTAALLLNMPLLG